MDRGDMGMNYKDDFIVSIVYVIGAYFGVWVVCMALIKLLIDD